jgi:hypothetical protein
MLGAQQLTADGPGEEGLAGLGTAGDEAADESRRLRERDGEDLGRMFDAV